MFSFRAEAVFSFEADKSKRDGVLPRSRSPLAQIFRYLWRKCFWKKKNNENLLFYQGLYLKEEGYRIYILILKI